MRFDLLCDDRAAAPVIQALMDRVDGHQLVYVVGSAITDEPIVQSKNSIRFVETWEDLPVERDIDAVLVGGGNSSILDGAKQLAAAGIPILFVPRADQGSTYIYELGLIHDDNHVPLIPLFWHRYDTAVVELKQVLSERRVGRIQFLQLNRGLSRPSSSVPISQAEIDAELLQDVDLLRWLSGDYDQVTCLRTAATGAGVLIQNVVLSGRSLPEANWSISPVDGPDQWRLTVRGDAGVAELRRDAGSRSWTFEIDGQIVQGNERQTSRNVLQAFSAAIESNHNQTVPRSMPPSDGWSDLVKCFETLDATERSIRRRRTIELHFEPMSERAIFKTQMTAIGCGMLIATLLLTLAFLAVSSVVPLPNPVLYILRLLVFAPLILFLVAQVMLPLTRPSSREQSQSP